MLCDRSTANSPASRSRRLLAGLCALALALTVASCSTLRIGYDNADTLLSYSFNNYFDLDDAQNRLLREQLRALMAWHRGSQLRDYVQVLDGWRAQLDLSDRRSIGAEDLLRVQDDIDMRLTALGERAAPDLARLALTLTPAQIEHCADKMAKDTAKARRDLGPGGRDALKKHIRQFTSRAEDWFGTLLPEQIELVRTALAARAQEEGERLAETERHQLQLVELLTRIHAEQPTRATATRWMQDYLATLLAGDEQGRRAARRRASAELIARLVGLATPEQRRKASDQLHKYAQDLAVLAAEGAAGERG